jgi:hypothetical protein
MFGESGYLLLSHQTDLKMGHGRAPKMRRKAFLHRSFVEYPRSSAFFRVQFRSGHVAGLISVKLFGLILFYLEDLPPKHEATKFLLVYSKRPVTSCLGGWNSRFSRQNWESHNLKENWRKAGFPPVIAA